MQQFRLFNGFREQAPGAATPRRRHGGKGRGIWRGRREKLAAEGAGPFAAAEIRGRMGKIGVQLFRLLLRLCAGGGLRARAGR